MESKHWLVLGMIVSGFGMQLAGAKSWSDILTPAFVSGTLLALGGAITALYTEKPKKDA